MKKPSISHIFISHISQEARLAAVLKKWIESAFVGYCETFVSSDESDLPAGVRYLEEINRALDTAKAVLVLCSPQSIARPWINIETGCAWIKRVPIIPICHSGQKKDQLPAPLAGFQALELEAPSFESTLLASLARHLGIPRPPRINEPEMHDELMGSLFPTPPPPGPPAVRPRALIFDIDGTLLAEDEESLDHCGHEWLDVFKRLAQKGFRFVFITGNDYEKQYPRILRPLIDRGLATSAFCFTDGGSRAFEFQVNPGKFVEIDDYSTANCINEGDIQRIKDEFDEAFRGFFALHESLRIPHVVPCNRTSASLDVVIRPIRPSIFRGRLFRRFSDDLQECCQNRPELQNTVFTFDQEKRIANALLIRALGKSPQVDDAVGKLIDIVFREILSKEEYRMISCPEAELRGGNVTCQIALKPFNDDRLRFDFRTIMEEHLRNSGGTAFDVSAGGRTTVDIQRLGVNKNKAVQFVMQRMGLDPSTTIYFGDEFGPHGNDLPVARMPNGDRPSLIVHVGNSNPEEDIKELLIWEGKGPAGTLNYLKVIDFEASL